MTRVLAQATVERFLPSTKYFLPAWIVSVTGEAPFDHRRTYTIAARSDNEAAMQGLRRFEDEMVAHEADIST